MGFKIIKYLCVISVLLILTSCVGNKTGNEPIKEERNTVASLSENVTNNTEGHEDNTEVIKDEESMEPSIVVEDDEPEDDSIYSKYINNEYIIFSTMLDSTDLSSQELAETVVNSYLVSRIDSDIDSERIRDFSIEEIEILNDESEAAIAFYAVTSFQFYEEEMVVTGSGIEGEDNWVHNIHFTFTIIIVNGECRLYI